jgi:hypothetical protein
MGYPIRSCLVPRPGRIRNNFCNSRRAKEAGVPTTNHRDNIPSALQHMAASTILLSSLLGVGGADRWVYEVQVQWFPQSPGYHAPAMLGQWPSALPLPGLSGAPWGLPRKSRSQSLATSGFSDSSIIGHHPQTNHCAKGLLDSSLETRSTTVASQVRALQSPVSSCRCLSSPVSGGFSTYARKTSLCRYPETCPQPANLRARHRGSDEH